MFLFKFLLTTSFIIILLLKILKILANKDAVFNADGNINLTATENVLGQTVPFVGEYGISKNPESFASSSYRAYFTDKQRGAVLRLSMDGITPISDANMRDWFRDKLKGDYLLIHGSSDDNVHLQNTMRMVEALVQANKQFEWAIYPDKDHGIYGGNTRLHLYKKMTNFLSKTLGDKISSKQN